MSSNTTDDPKSAVQEADQSPSSSPASTETPSSSGSDADDSTTSSTSVRWRFTNDVLAGLILGAHLTALAASVRFGVDVPQRMWDVFVFEVVAAAAWTFGPSTVNDALDAWRGNSGEK